jgi:hypothetical protein
MIYLYTLVYIPQRFEDYRPGPRATVQKQTSPKHHYFWLSPCELDSLQLVQAKLNGVEIRHPMLAIMAEPGWQEWELRTTS